jgi:hypothetical protein
MLALISTFILFQRNFSLKNFIVTFRQLPLLEFFINFFGLLFIFFLLVANSMESIAFGAGLCLTALWLQPNTLALIVENVIMLLPRDTRIKTANWLLKNACTLTPYNVYKYIIFVLEGEFANFKETLKDSINDLKVGFFLKEPKMTVDAFAMDIYRMQLKYLKYVKVEEPKILALDTQEEYEAVSAFWKKARNPHITFSLIRRLPMVFVYRFEQSIFFKLLIQNVIVIYSFFKTTIISLLLMFIYFLYTIFFFKIQFIKQLAVWFVIGMIYF